ncbi:MAG: hypothetical protein M1548_08575 [Actinobacteria bacterium]|nr:hypothetical protein [Actinomycetota bacterium]
MSVYLNEQGKEVFVAAGLGGDIFGTFHHTTSGNLRRLKSQAMPMVDSREKAQANLDA